MARGRMLDSSIWNNEKFGALPMGAQLLQIGMINHADDQGRIKANPQYLSKAIFLYNEEVTVADIRKWMELLHANGTIILYVVEDKQYAQLVNWWKYQNLQYAQPSEYPRPEGWQDRIRRTITKTLIVTCNWVKVNGEPVPDTCDMDGKYLPGSTGHKPPPFTPKSNPPSPNGASAHTPDCEPDDSGEYSPEETPDDSPERSGYFIKDHDLTELNLTNGVSIDPVSTARARSDQPTAPAPPTNSFGTRLDDPRILSDDPPMRQPEPTPPEQARRMHRLRAKQSVTFFDPRKLVGGYIPKGTGENGTEVYFEFHRLSNRSPPSRTSMERMNEIDDLARWRQVLEKCALKNWQPGNISDRLEVYRSGFRHEQAAQAPSPPAKVDYAIAGML